MVAAFAPASRQIKLRLYRKGHKVAKHNGKIGQRTKRNKQRVRRNESGKAQGRGRQKAEDKKE